MPDETPRRSALLPPATSLGANTTTGRVDPEKEDHVLFSRSGHAQVGTDGVNMGRKMKGWLVRSIGKAALPVLLQFTPAYGQGVTIELEGRIPVACGIEALTSQITLGDIAVAGVKTLPFRVRCNAPFSFALLSRNGALRTTSPPPMSWGFTDHVPYTIALQIPTNVGAVAGACPSWRLRHPSPLCTYPDSGDGIALAGEASLTISWGSRRDPLAGTYSDVMTVVLGARL
jgi:hypothetical protein